MTWQYEDLVDLPHPVSRKHPPMAMADRAAQFAPFAALTGYDGVIRETARLVNQSVELTESRKLELDAALRMLSECSDFCLRVQIVHFVPDGRKAGGAYIRTVGQVKRVDGSARAVVFTDGSAVDIDTIIEIQLEKS